MVEVVAVDVPGVPVAGPVLVELEHVAHRALGENVTIAVEIEDPGEDAVAVPLEAEVAVGHPAVTDLDRFIGVSLGRPGVDRRPPERRHVDEPGTAADVDDLVAAERRRVEDDGRLGQPRRVDRGGDGVEGGAGHGGRPALDLCQLGFGLLGHPADR